MQKPGAIPLNTTSYSRHFQHNRHACALGPSLEVIHYTNSVVVGDADTTRHTTYLKKSLI